MVWRRGDTDLTVRSGVERCPRHGDRRPRADVDPVSVVERVGDAGLDRRVVVVQLERHEVPVLHDQWMWMAA